MADAAITASPGSAPSFQDTRTRRSIVVAYWSVILLCVPYWWYSTTIERHALPLFEMEQWQLRKVSKQAAASDDDDDDDAGVCRARTYIAG